jgi:thiamine biosynthesis lipoprotein
VVLDEANQTVTYLTPGMQLDLGGFSKGYVTYQIYELLRAQGIEHALINIGSSSQMTIGTRVQPLNNTEGTPRFIPQTEAWRIGTKDPFDPLGIAPAIGAFGLSNKALSSSGSSQQYFEMDGRRYHHLFDPATGYPVENELIVVQVVSDDPVGIDSLSTLAYLLGLEEGVRLIESLEGVEAIFITYDKRIFTTSGFASFNLFDSTYRVGQWDNES